MERIGGSRDSSGLLRASIFDWTRARAQATGTDVLLTDATADDLLAFGASVNELRFAIQGGGTSANLLPTPTTVDLLHLDDAAAWLHSGTLPNGTYTGVQLTFAPGTYTARVNDGSSVAVTSTADQLTLPLAQPLVVDGTGYDRIVIDLDVGESMTVDVTGLGTATSNQVDTFSVATTGP